MFLRNYDNYWTAMHLFTSDAGAATYGSTAEFADGFLNQKLPNGAIESISICSALNTYSPAFYPPLNISTKGICLGDGEAEVTYDDYKLSGNVVPNNLILQSSSSSYDADSQSRIYEFICTYYNSSSDSILIKEWGLFRGNPGSSSLVFSNSSADTVLMYREVLAEPISIAPGETSTISFSVFIPTSTQ